MANITIRSLTTLQKSTEFRHQDQDQDQHPDNVIRNGFIGLQVHEEYVSGTSYKDKIEHVKRVTKNDRTRIKYAYYIRIH